MPSENSRQSLLFPELNIDVDDLDPTDTNDFIDYSQLGRYAEFLVCAELTRLGYRAIHVDAPGFDIILVVENKSLRVQVKSTNRIFYPPQQTPKGRQPRTQPFAMWTCGRRYSVCAGKGGRFSRNTEPLTEIDADMVALFHLKFCSTVFCPIRVVKRRMALPITQITQIGIAEKTLKSTLLKLC